MALFNMKTTEDEINMIEKSIKSKTAVSFLAVGSYHTAYMVTFNAGLLTIEDRYDTYEYQSELIITSSGKILAVKNDEEIVLSLSKLEKLREE